MIITLSGPNSFLLRAELNRLKDAFIAEHDELAYEKIDGEEASSERIIEAALSLPFLVSKKLVILRSPSAQKQFVDDIEQVLAGVPEATDLVIVEPKIDKRSVYYKVLKAKTEFREFGHQDISKLNNWVVQYVKDSKGEIKLQDANYLIERVGPEQQLLANELDKLLIYNPKVSKASIDLLTDQLPQSTIFELLDCAFAGDAKKTLQLYTAQRAMKVEPQQIIAMLAWQLQVLALVKTAGERSVDDIAKQARLNPFVVSKTIRIARRLTLTDVKRLIASALRLDIRLKSEAIDADDALQQYLLAISS